MLINLVLYASTLPHLLHFILDIDTMASAALCI